jgi:hypothetical protein
MRGGSHGRLERTVAQWFTSAGRGSRLSPETD